MDVARLLGWMDGWIFGLCGGSGLPLASLLVVCASAEVGCEAARLSEMPTWRMGHRRRGGLTRETRYREMRVVVAGVDARPEGDDEHPSMRAMGVYY